MALTLAGAAPPFADVARAALRTTAGHAALATRLEGRVPAVVEPPHVSAPRVDLVVDRLLALPA